MSAQRAAWLTEFHAEQAARQNVHFSQSMLDLVKAFELIPHHHIILAAIKHGYPLYLLRLSLAAYRFPRVVSITGTYSRPVVATCGIVAGSGFATTELRVLLLDVIDSACRICPEVSLKVYVDDISISATHSMERTVANLVAEATDLIVTFFERNLNLEVSKTKSAVVCSTLSLARRTAASTRSGKISARRTSKLLGVATCGGRRRVVKAIKKRVKDFARKVTRFHVLRRANVRVTQMVQAVASPSMTYGIECAGVANAPLAQMRSKAAAAAAPEACGKNPDLVLHTVDAGGSTIDPSFAAHALPVKFWALAVWQRWTDAQQLENAFHAADAYLQRGKQTLWNKVTGPCMVVSLR